MNLKKIMKLVYRLPRKVLKQNQFLPALQLLFIALKLTKFIDWSWWLVLLPTISQIGIIGVLLIILLILCLINNFLK